MKTVFAMLFPFLLGGAWSAYAQPVLLGEDLSSNRRNSLPDDTLQVVLFYDGAQDIESTDLMIELESTPEQATSTDYAYIDIARLRKFTNLIETREYSLGGYTPTGHFFIRGVVPDGGIDGLAFGLFWKDAGGNYHTLKSNDDRPSAGARFVCAWPLAMNNRTFEERTPRISSGAGRETARMTICGAKLLDNGSYFLTEGIGLTRRERVLTVTVEGGPSSVRVEPGHQVCDNPDGATTVCRFRFPEGEFVRLEATFFEGNPPPGFLGWSGDCHGTELTCELEMNRDRAVFGNFTGM